MKTLQAELDRLDVTLPFEEFGQGFVSLAPAIDRAEIEFLHHRFLRLVRTVGWSPGMSWSRGK
jgi:hypothetical protein